MVGIILGRPGPFPDLPGNDYLRDFQQKPISVLFINKLLRLKLTLTPTLLICPIHPVYRSLAISIGM